MAYDYIRYRQAGYTNIPELEEGDYAITFENSSFRGVMKGVGDERKDRLYLGISADVPEWYEETWSVCRPPSEDEHGRLEERIAKKVGPGSRFEAICEIDADGDIFVRGWVVSVPRL